MGKNKLSRFAENLTFDHVVQPTFTELQAADLRYKGRWNMDFFKREAPLVLELGCGGGEYTVGLAQLQPGKNYIGIDIKGARIWRGAKTAKELGLENVGFVRTHVDHILRCFGKHEVSEIWLTFSDPQIGKARKRLTSPLFLARYKEILKPDGLIHRRPTVRSCTNTRWSRSKRTSCPPLSAVPRCMPSSFRAFHPRSRRCSTSRPITSRCGWRKGGRYTMSGSGSVEHRAPSL